MKTIFLDKLSINLKNELYNFNNNKAPAPSALHFIWLGEDHQKNMFYVDVWETNNDTKKIFRWIDVNTSSCKILDKTLKRHALKKTSSFNEYEFFLNEIRNSAFLFVWSNLSCINNFNSLVEKFLIINSIEYDTEDFKLKNNALTNNFYFDINTLFNGSLEPYKKFYYIELILRCNLACASDLIRLLILYKHGGVYIDVDTLPYIDNNFSSTNNFLNSQGLAYNEAVNLTKSHLFLASILNKKPDWDEIKTILAAGSVSNNDSIIIANLLLEDFEKSTKMTPTPLAENLVTKDSLLLSSISCNDGIFYNNVICSHAESRIIKFLLLRIKRRYNYLEKAGFMFSTPITHDDDFSDNEYLKLFKYYRRDFIFGNEYVTKHLTGPTFIVKSIFEIISKFYKIKSPEELNAIFEALKNPIYGISFMDQNLDTPAGMLSSWREGNNG